MIKTYRFNQSKTSKASKRQKGKRDRFDVLSTNLSVDKRDLEIH